MTIQKKQNWVTEKKKMTLKRNHTNLENSSLRKWKDFSWLTPCFGLGSALLWISSKSAAALLILSSLPPARMHCISACAEFSKWPTPWPSGYWTWWGLDQAAFVCLLCQSFIMLKLFRANILWLVLERVKISESWIQSCVKGSYWS